MLRTRLIWPALALGTVLFYGTLLFRSQTSIHWDLADISYPAQSYFAGSIQTGKLPQWTPYLNSGIPFLSDPRTGAWYPLHWPFFLIGVTPRAMAWELALHAFLAWAGAFLLARKLFGPSGPAALGGMLYAFGGYFAAHSSLLGKFEAAALLPWLLWTALGALETGELLWIGGAALTGGLIALAGDIASALESFLALLVLAGAARAPWQRTVRVVAFLALGAVLLSAIVWLPALELNQYSVHADQSNAALHPGDLATLVAADYYGLMSGLYNGPEDIRQHYFYGSLLLLPLALAGFARREKVWIPLALLIAGVWFAFGRRALLYSAFAAIPAVHGSAPVDVWFVAALALALAAASGAQWIVERIGRPYIWLGLVALGAVDLWNWNMNKNPLVYARASFNDLYGKPFEGFEKRIAEVKQRPFSRIWSPFVPLSLGPADAPLMARAEVTYGTGLAELERYGDYTRAIASNPQLLNGLAVTHGLEERGLKLIGNPQPLGRISAPPEVIFVPDRKTALAALESLDPEKSAVVEAPPQAVHSTVSEIRIMNYEDDSYRIGYVSSSDSLLRIAVPFYPGWTALVDDQPLEIVPVDVALMGVIVPSGPHQLRLKFRSRRLLTGAALSTLAGAGLLSVFLVSAFRRRSR